MRNRIGRPRFMQSFTSAGGGPFLATPPSDGETYGVRNADTWIEVCEEAPKNGTLYGRISNAWQPIPSGGDPGTASGVLFTPAGNISATNVQAAIQELDNEKVAKSGGANAIMTGFLTLHADPDAPLKAATKQYVDTALGNAGVTIADTAPTPSQGKMWWESDTGVLWMSYTDASSTQWIGVGGTTAAISDASKADKTYVDAQDALKADKTYVDAQDLLSVLRDGTRTMTGNLVIEKTDPVLSLKGTNGSWINSTKNTYTRWTVALGETTQETGGNLGSDFAIIPHTDAGVSQPYALRINRNGLVAIPTTAASTSPTTGALTVAGGVGIGGSIFAADSLNSGSQVNSLNNGGSYQYTLERTVATARKYGFAILGDGRFTLDDITAPAARLSILTNGTVNVLSTTASTSYTTGALVVSGGVGIAGNIYVQTPNVNLALQATTGDPAMTWWNAGGRQWTMVVPASNSQFWIVDADSAQGVALAQNSASWGAASDRRMPWKQSRKPVSVLDHIAELELWEFERNGMREYGAIAQDLHEVFPALVQPGLDDDDRELDKMDPGMWTITYDRAGVLALGGVKELLARVEQLERRRV